MCLCTQFTHIGGANTLLHAIALVLDGRERQVHAPAAFTHMERAPNMNWYLGGPQSKSGLSGD